MNFFSIKSWTNSRCKALPFLMVMVKVRVNVKVNFFHFLQVVLLHVKQKNKQTNKQINDEKAKV